MQNTTRLALMCKSRNYKIDPHTKEYRVGNWVIGKNKQNGLIGARVVLTESQKAPAYLGGTIVGIVPTVSGKCEVVFKEDEAMVGNEDAVGHRGWGTGRSVCYV